MAMLEAKRREAWDHTATILALIANCNRDPKKRKRPYGPEDFHPYRQPARPAPIPAGIEALKCFVARPPPKNTKGK